MRDQPKIVTDLGQAIKVACWSIGLSNGPSVQKFAQAQMRKLHHDGEAYLFSLKKWLARANQHVLEGTPIPADLAGKISPSCIRSMKNRTRWLQYLKLKRALPAIRDKVILAAKTDEFVDLATRPQPSRPVPEVLVNRIRAVCHGLLNRDVPDVPLASASSCLGCTRREGGRSSLIAAVYGPPPPTLPKYRTEDTGVSRYKRLDQPFATLQTRQSYLWGKLRDSIPPMEPLPVPERGAKVRMVEKSHPVHVAESHRVRRRYFPSLQKLSRVSVSEALLDPELKTIGFEVADLRDRYVISADLTRATDEMSHEVLDELTDRLAIDPKITHRGLSLRDKPVTAGTPMGLGGGWTLMSIAHYCAASVVDPKHNFRIKGDDLIALWTLVMYQRYRELMLAIGFIVNDKGAVSKNFGTFCEGDYRLVGSTLHRLPTFSLRSFVENSPLQPVQWLALEERGVNMRRLHFMTKRCHKDWLQAASKYGLDPYSPTQFGGLGLCPGPSLTLVKRPVPTILARRAHNGLCVVDYRVIGSPTLREKSLLFAIERIPWKVDDSPGGETAIRHYDACVTHAIAAATLADRWEGMTPPAPPVVTPFRLARRISRVVKRELANNVVGPYSMTYRGMLSLIGRLRPNVRKLSAYGRIEAPRYEKAALADLQVQLTLLLKDRDKSHDPEPFENAFNPSRVGKKARARAREGALN